MSEQISKHTIAVLVILTVVISFLGTWTVMNEVSKVRVNNRADASSTAEPVYTHTGKVSLNIQNPETMRGKVTLNI